MNLTAIMEFASRVPQIIAGAMAIVHKVEGAGKDQKINAVISSIPDSVSLYEFAAGSDVFNDAKVQDLMKAVANAAHALADAQAALKAGIVNHATGAAK